MGATDSMWPKKRRILLRVLKAVAILRPRKFKGGIHPAAFSELPARQPFAPSVAEGHLSEKTLWEVCSDKEPSLFFKPLGLFSRCRPPLLFLAPLPRQGERNMIAGDVVRLTSARPWRPR